MKQIPNDPKTKQIVSTLINVESHLEFVWVQFDQADVGKKTCHDNKHLNTQGIKQEWTLIKPITTQFAVGRNRIAQVVRKQFALQTAAAKTIHRSQGDTKEKIVINFLHKKNTPHIHYVGLSRVTTIDGLYIRAKSH